MLERVSSLGWDRELQHEFDIREAVETFPTGPDAHGANASCFVASHNSSVQHKIAVDEHKRLQQQQTAEKRRAKNQVTKKLTLEQIAAAEVKRCEKVKKREAMDNDEIKNLVALCGF